MTHLIFLQKYYEITIFGYCPHKKLAVPLQPILKNSNFWGFLRYAKYDKII